MKDNINPPNLGVAPEAYDKTFFWRTYRNIETFLSDLRSKGPVIVSVLTADEIFAYTDITTQTGFTADGPAGTSRYLQFTTSNGPRWIISADVTPESGGNAGSDFAIYRYSDAGTFLGQPLYIQRSTGNAYFENAINGVVATLTNTDSGQPGITGLDLYRNSSSPAVNDVLQILSLTGNSSTGVKREYARVTAQIASATDGAEYGYGYLQAIQNGTATNIARWGGLDGVFELSTGQLRFPATQVSSANVNTLDDYEEGTWTPTLSFGGASTGITYGARTATYTKIGRLVFVSFDMTLTSKGSATGASNINGLPFGVSASSSNAASSASYYQNMALMTGVPVAGFSGGQFFMRQFGTAATVGSLTDANYTNTTRLIMSGVYETAT